eukprot:884712-Rhodomonas_salina.2
MSIQPTQNRLLPCSMASPEAEPPKLRSSSLGGWRALTDFPCACVKAIQYNDSTNTEQRLSPWTKGAKFQFEAACCFPTFHGKSRCPCTNSRR